MKKTVSILIFAAVSMAMMAVPAKRGGIIRTAEDGTEKIVYLHGNEWFHYMTDEEGNWLDERSLLPLTEEAKAKRLAVSGERKARKQKQDVGGVPNIAPRGLIILVNFKDKAFSTPKDTIDSMMNGANFTRHYDYDYYYSTRHYVGTCDAHGSARKYFQDQSYGQYNPIFDVVGPYTVSGNIATYGSNSGGSDSNVGQLIKEACTLANNDGADFTLYDNDNNGKVDFVYVIYAGYGEADGGPAETIWPHNYMLSYTGYSCRVDGKTIDNYACSNEIDFGSKVYAGIGTFCHEFGHVIGLPDIYSTDNNSVHKTSGMWDIMDYGPYSNEGNTPPGYSAYERFYCGWLTPRVLTDAENVTLQPIDNQEALLLCSGNSHNLSGYNPNPSTFYLLEARNKTGWDTFIPGEGMLITKIIFSSYYWSYNSVNYSPNEMHIDILEADGLAPSYSAGDRTNGWFGKATDAFPAGATSWTVFANHELTDITRDANGTIHFKYRGGTPTTEVVEQTTDNTKAQKILKDGRVVIVRGNKTYDILGNENHQL